MGFVVKNTTKFNVLDLICPHTCRGCGDLGAVLCERCKNDMMAHYEPICPICKEKVAQSAEKVGNITGTTSEKRWKCENCKTPFGGVWCFGVREGALEKLVEEYKYQSVRAMGEVLAELYDKMIPQGLGEEVVVVPLPTIGRHIRERGFDHTATVAKKLARRRGWRVERVLGREVDTVQVGAKAADRRAQAKRAYAVVKPVKPEVKYLLVDDVWTTGATMLAAAEVLKKAGASKIYAAVLAVSKPKEELGEKDGTGQD